MTSAVGPGSLVICIKALPKYEIALFPGAEITVGALYTVEQIIRKGIDYGGIFSSKFDAYRLKERPGLYGHSKWIAYNVEYFKPLNDGDTSLVENEITIDDAPTTTKELELN